MKPLIRVLHKHHQTAGLLCWLLITAWTLSGLAHPIMSRLNPVPAQWTAPAEPLTIDTLALPALRQAQAARLFMHRGQPVLQTSTAQAMTYRDARNLSPLPDFERQYAVDLARHFTGEHTAAVTGLRLIHQFDADYLQINRLLPVYRVDFDRNDGLRAYVDVSQGQLATLVDDRKALLSSLFRALHTWHWWPQEASRRWAMGGFLLLTVLLALAGSTVYLRWWRTGVFRQQARWGLARKLHAHLSGAVALALLAFSLSGLLHLLVTEARAEIGEQQANTLAPAPIRIPAGTVEAQWIAVGGQGYWRLTGAIDAAAGHHGPAHGKPGALRYLDSDGQSVDSATAESQLALALAAAWQSPNTQAVYAGHQTHFSGDYGFINKRLPVAQVDLMDANGTATGTRLYLQLHTRTLAAVVTPRDRLEGFSFAYLHKWHHLDVLGKNVRDGLLGLSALLILVATSLGAVRYLCRRSRSLRTANAAPSYLAPGS